MSDDIIRVVFLAHRKHDLTELVAFQSSPCVTQIHPEQNQRGSLQNTKKRYGPTNNKRPLALCAIVVAVPLTAYRGQCGAVCVMSLMVTDSSQVDGSSHFKLLGGAFTGSLLKLAPVDVGHEAVDLH